MTRRLSAPLPDSPPQTTKSHNPAHDANDHQTSAPGPGHIPGMPAILDALDAEAMARRKLLKLAAYTVPLVVGTLVAGPAEALSALDEGCLNSEPGKNKNCYD